jgi:N-acetylneuraminic acid mutarotase
LATVVPFGDSFLLVGGGNNNSCLSTIYHYKPQEDSWTLLDARMKEGKYGVIAMLVEREMLVK